MAATAIRPAPGRSLTHFADVTRSELCKLRSVRSTYWALLAAVTFNVVTAALLGIFLPRALSAHQRTVIDSTRVSLGGMHVSQVAIGLLGVLVITSEYSTGMIRATLAAVPQRRLVLAAKTLVLAVVAVTTAVAASFAAYLIFQAFLPAGDAMATSLADPGVLRAVTGAGLYLAGARAAGPWPRRDHPLQRRRGCRPVRRPVRALHSGIPAAAVLAEHRRPLPPDERR
jgi:hypothetical protein